MRKPIEFTRFPKSFNDAQQDGQWRAVGKYVVDGDTFDCFVDKGFYEYQFLTIRVADINTPEMVGVDAATLERAKAARFFTANCVMGRPLLLRPRMLNSGERVTFDRFVADVSFWDVAWDSLANALVESGHAVRV